MLENSKADVLKLDPQKHSNLLSVPFPTYSYIISVAKLAKNLKRCVLIQRIGPGFSFDKLN